MTDNPLPPELVRTQFASSWLDARIAHEQLQDDESRRLRKERARLALEPNPEIADTFFGPKKRMNLGGDGT